MGLETLAHDIVRRLQVRPRQARNLQRLGRLLPRAGYLVLPETFVAQALVASLFAGLGALVVPAALVAASAGGLRTGAAAWAGALLVPPATAFCTYALRVRWPRARAPLRARAIEAQMPFAINYMSTLASGRLHLDQIFADLAQQPVYGEIATEAGLVHRDLALLGRDIVAALGAAIARSPSRKWEDFLQGLLVTVTAGGDLQGFLVAKSEQHFGELRTLQRGFLENLELLAEVFVVLVVAAPLLFLIVLSILTLFGRDAGGVLLLGYLLVLVLLPLTQFAFGTVIRILSPEG